MKTSTSALLPQIVSYLFVVLFTYAAVSKLLDFENFQVQLGQSPLLSAFAGWVAIGVPLAELIIGALLCLPAMRHWGLVLAYVLMVAFTAYIYIILNFSTFVPCSCGGILEKLGWKQHMVFNVIFIVLAMAAVLASDRLPKTSPVIRAIRLVMLGLLVSAGMYAAFLASEELIRYHNSFIRRFPHHPAEPKDTVDLGAPTYYYAGTADGKIFLGNQRNPFQAMELDSSRLVGKTHKMELKTSQQYFKSLQLRVAGPDFFLFDGTKPAALAGERNNWTAYPVPIHGRRFSQPSLIGSSALAARSQKPRSGENAISVFNLHSARTFENDRILIRQIDGLFDTDGLLHYDALTGRLLYCYKYRNGYMYFGPSLSDVRHGTTIDTISRAQISVAHVKSRDELKFDKPPLTVNRTSTFHAGLLFVSSGIPGRFEKLEAWEDASIIDVYDVQSNAYLLSFYLYDYQGEKARQFFIYGNSLYTMTGSTILKYALTPTITRHFRIKE